MCLTHETGKNIFQGKIFFREKYFSGMRCEVRGILSRVSSLKCICILYFYRPVTSHVIAYIYMGDQSRGMLCLVDRTCSPSRARAFPEGMPLRRLQRSARNLHPVSLCTPTSWKTCVCVCVCARMCVCERGREIENVYVIG